MELTATRAARLRPAEKEQAGECYISPTRAEYRRQLKECERMLRSNETLFNMEIEDTMIDSRIYEREALLCRHKYLLEKVRGGE